jgi:hypothetical protein
VDERRHYLTDGLRPVCCAGCGGEVSVRKHSRAQTSIQWTTAAVAACHEFAGRASALVPGCRTLRESIVAAVRSGAIEVPDG